MREFGAIMLHYKMWLIFVRPGRGTPNGFMRCSITYIKHIFPCMRSRPCALLTCKRSGGGSSKQDSVFKNLM